MVVTPSSVAFLFAPESDICLSCIAAFVTSTIVESHQTNRSPCNIDDFFVSLSVARLFDIGFAVKVKKRTLFSVRR